jgi:hypothetical protein
MLEILAGFFLGLIIGLIVSYFMNKRTQVGEIKIEQVGDTKQYSLELARDPEGLDDKKEVTFKVKKVHANP